MEFTLTPEVDEYRLRIREFVETHIIPIESDPTAYDEHENINLDRLRQLRDIAKQQGLWALQMPKERGGQGLPVGGLAACYEEMNRSIFGPAAFNSAAPDDGNMTILNKVAREEQKDKWLQPIIDGEVQSSFVMTEPHPGSGSDPSMMLTKAEKKGDTWVINGSKWFITGAENSKHFILIARTSDDPRKGLSAFMYHADQPGWRITFLKAMQPERSGAPHRSGV